jgi:hypothetical protein
MILQRYDSALCGRTFTLHIFRYRSAADFVVQYACTKSYGVPVQSTHNCTKHIALETDILDQDMNTANTI